VLQATQVTIAAIGLIVLVALRGEIRRTYNDEGLARLMLLGSMIGGGIAVNTVFLNTSNIFRLVLIALIALSAFASILTSGRREGGAERHALPAILGLLLWLWLFVADLEFAQNLTTKAEIARLLAGLAWLAVLAVRVYRPLSLRSVAVIAAASVAVTSIGTLLLPVDHAWRTCDKYKCGSFGALLHGPFESENYFAMQASLVGILVLVSLRGRVRVWAAALCIVILVASGSRTSILVFAMAVFILIVWRRRESPHARPFAVRALAIGIVPPLVGWIMVTKANSHSFSDRGSIWQQALATMPGHYLTGQGVDQWYVLQDAGLVPDHFPHSQILLIMFSGGTIAAALYCVWLWAACAQALRLNPGDPGVALFLITFAMIGLTEVVWNPLTFDGLTWAAMALSAATVGVADRGYVIRDGRSASPDESNQQRSIPIET
jgi:hypothetical protein